MCPVALAAEVPGYQFALPAGCQVKVRWVCPPLDPNQLEQAGWSGKYEGQFRHQFAVDGSGMPWFALCGDYQAKGQVLNPLKRYRFGLSHPFEGMVCLDNGALLFHTDHDLGFVGTSDMPVGQEVLPVLPFQPAVALPRPHSRVYAGANNAVYLVGTADQGDQEVYLLQPEALSQGGQKIVRSFRKIFTTSSEKIGAVTGDGQTTFIALGRTLARITLDRQTPPDILLHPEEDIVALAYSPAAGLFYATDSAVGVVGENGAWDFLPFSWAQIAVRGESLYVCLSDTLGVLALDHVAGLAKYARNAPYVLQPAKAQPIKVASLEFQASPVDSNSPVMLGHEFERFEIRRIRGVVHLHPTGKLVTCTALTVQWSGPKDLREDGYLQSQRTQRRVLDFRRGEDQHLLFDAPFAENFYPGEYVMKVLINGTEAGTGSFTITGPTTIMEAALQDNIPLLQTLLADDTDPKERDVQCCAALFTAAFNGSTAAADLLLQHGAQVNAENDHGPNALFNSILGYDSNPAGVLNTAKLLIQHGADLSAKDEDGHSLLEAVFNNCGPGMADLMDLLLQQNLDVNARDARGRTLLACLATAPCPYPQAQSPMAECLIRHGADVAATDSNGVSVLNCALGSSDSESDLVQVLLAHGANPNQPSIDKKGNKAFPLVQVNPRRSDMLGRLLAHGADPDVEDFPGYTALAKAIDDVEPEAVRILLGHGASVASDCRVQYQAASPLRGALASYLAYAAKDRVKAQKAKDVFFLLLERGARLRTQEESIVADKRLHGWLPPDFILDVLTRNDQAVLDARDLTDAPLQRVVIDRLLNMARAKTAAATSQAGYQAALALCDQAKTRAQVWRIESQCPLIYYNMGLLYGQLGEIEAAKDNFRRYLDLAPQAQDAEAIKKSVGL
jgi:ankyrin repeat protein